MALTSRRSTPGAASAPVPAGMMYWSMWLIGRLSGPGSIAAAGAAAGIAGSPAVWAATGGCRVDPAQECGRGRRGHRRGAGSARIRSSTCASPSPRKLSGRPHLHASYRHAEGLQGEGIATLLAATEAVHIDGQRLDGHGIEAADPGRHHAAAARADALDDRLAAAAIEPDAVRQVGCALVELTLAVGAVAARALVGEHLGAPAGRCRVGRFARQRQHVLGRVDDLRLLQQLVEAVARHLHGARLLVVGADAVGDGLVDVLDAAAPDPVVVVEIGITGKPLRA